MSFPPMSSTPSGEAAARAPRKRGALLPTLVIIGVLFVLVMVFAQVWTEVLWFRQIRFMEVFSVTWITRIVMFLIAGAVMGFAVWGSFVFAYRTRPIYVPTTPAQQSLDQYRAAVEPLRKVIVIVVPAILGVFAGIAGAGRWDTVQMWLHRQPFGQVDPQFKMDMSFYVFSLPLARAVVSFLMAVVFLAAMAGLIMQYLYGGIRIGPKGSGRVTRAARAQLSSLAALFCLLIGVNYWLDRYSMLTNSGGLFDGAAYTDITAVLPAKTILAGIAVVVAALFVFVAFRGNWKLPTLGVGLMIVSAIVIGGIYPWVVQAVQVKPNEQQLETPYIQRNIDATLTAYGLDDVETKPYDAKTTAERGALRKDAESTASIRLLDPTVVSPAFRQLQQNRGYYTFVQNLAVDRYTVDDKSRDTVIAVREPNQAGIENQNWVNLHTVYTHGFGIVAAYGNTTDSAGKPSFYEKDIPATGPLGKFEERVYFSQNAPEYSVVGAPSGTEPWELDYPDDSAPKKQVNTTYTGDGGPSVGNFLNKLLYAAKFGSLDILFSNRVTADSQILYDRDPQDRVAKVAPYLTLDDRAYPAVVDGRIVWIVDAYTTTDAYPYAESTSFETATTDSQTIGQTGTALTVIPRQVNYIRNSVKAVVDAYDGSVTLYAWDAEDPILKAWSQVYPTSLVPMENISGSLMSHLRYPEDMFKVQRQLLTRYHVTDADTFFGGQGFWEVPADPTVSDQTKPNQPPYYMTLQMPGQDAPSFSLTSTFIPISGGGANARNVLTGFLAVDSEPGNKDGTIREGYGKLRLLELPQGSTVPGPGQVQNSFNSDPRVSGQLNLLRQGGSQVIWGNLLTLPVGGGLLYVEPVYIQASSGTQFPSMQKVLVAFGDTIGFEKTLQESLDAVFKGDSGATAGDAGLIDTKEDTTTETGTGTDGTGGVTPTPTGTAVPTETPTQTPTATPGGAATGTATPGSVADALDRANQALTDSDNAMRAGDWEAYGKAQQELKQALEDATAAEGK